MVEYFQFLVEPLLFIMFHRVVDGGEEDLDRPLAPLVVIFQFFVRLVGEAEGDTNHPSMEVGVDFRRNGGWFPCHVTGPL